MTENIWPPSQLEITNADYGACEHTLGGPLHIPEATQAITDAANEAKRLIAEVREDYDELRKLWRPPTTCGAEPESCDPRLDEALASLQSGCGARADAGMETRGNFRRIARLRARMATHPRFAAAVQKRFVEEYEDDTGAIADVSAQSFWDNFNAWLNDHQGLLRVISIVVSLLCFMAI